MHPAPDPSWSPFAKFLRQHTPDVCNDLNGLDLETVLLADFIASGEGGETIRRIRSQIRRLAADLRGLSRKFSEPNPVRAVYPARELFLIWQDQPATLDPAPNVQWRDTLGAEEVTVEASAVADVFRELLANAHAFGTGDPIFATSRMEEGQVVFELREPKHAPVDPGDWGSAPFASMRHGHYGLGLWAAQRTITANGGEVRRRYAHDAKELITTLRFPVA